MKLLTTQKDHLYDQIIDSDYFTPSQFKIEEKEIKTSIIYIDSDYFFDINETRNVINRFTTVYSPADEITKDIYPDCNWTEIQTLFSNWLIFLERELTAENKWDRLFKEMNYLKVAKISDESRFTYNEYLDLSIKIESIKTGINSIPLSDFQLKAISSQLDHLLSIANDLNKFDWQSLFLGAIISVIIQLGVTQNNAQLLYNLIKITFKGLFIQ